jgi:hypothetical protein
MAYANVDTLLNTIPDDLPYKASVKRVLLQAPEADVVEVVHGHWIRMGDRYANCSNCGTAFEALPTMFAFEANNIFCRHCGARMNGERGEKE